jgi:hypothetical protein
MAFDRQHYIDRRNRQVRQLARLRSGDTCTHGGLTTADTIAGHETEIAKIDMVLAESRWW